MKLTISIALIVSSISGVVASPATRAVQDVFVPLVLIPAAGTVWTSGQQQIVTWDASSPPAQITNKVGTIFLRKDDNTTPLILANGFDILSGQQNVTVPVVLEGDDYKIVLFGDSGNFSPKFTITGSGVQ